MPGENGASDMNGHAESMHVWIDCDAGVDDAQGLLIALSMPNVHIVGISCVHGNVDLNKVALNVARILTLCGREDIPIYRGCEEPLMREPIKYDFFHGLDGLGDVPDAAPAAATIVKRPEPDIAVVGLLRAAREYQGRLTLVALGPLTNIAVALKTDVHFQERIQKLVVMGGAEAVGNISPVAEFNFHCDPESARLVLHKFPRLTLLTWEATKLFSLPWEFIDQWLLQPTSKTAFMAAIMAKSAESERRLRPHLGWTACDAVAVAVALHPDLITASKEVFCDMELRGTLTRGMSVFDWNGLWKQKPNVDLVTQIDMEGLMRVMQRSLQDA